MAKNKNLAATLIDEYAELGFGEKLDDFTIRSHDGEVKLELDSIEDETTEEIIGLEVFNDGFSVAELLYDDKEFNEKLLHQVTAALNV